MSDDAPPANTKDEIAGVASAFVQKLQEQIVAADKAGASDRDLCIVLPAGYMALVFAMPMIRVKDDRGRESLVALCTKKSANALIQTLIRESGWSP